MRYTSSQTIVIAKIYLRYARRMGGPTRSLSVHTKATKQGVGTKGNYPLKKQKVYCLRYLAQNFANP